MTGLAYTHLLFDADDTLFDFKEAELQAFTKVFSDFGYPCDAATYQIYHEENKRCWKELEAGLCTRPQLLFNRFDRTFQKIGITGDPLAVQNKYEAALAENGILYSNTIPLLKRLSASYSLALITNGATVIQKRRLEKSGVSPYFDGIFISEEMGVAKPAKDYFDRVLDALQVLDRRQVLVIGDSLSSDVMGAINSDLDICWFNPGKTPLPENLSVTYEIRQLEELYDILQEKDLSE